jgi:two-component system catabolic regulation response regulator CreB
MNLEGQGRRVVIADHDRAVLELLEIRLGLGGFETYVERSGETALTTIKRVRPAAVVIERNLPDLDAFALMQALDRQGEGIKFPILLVGRRLAPDDVRQAIQLGARDCMIKPFSGADVLDRVCRMFRRPAPPPRAVLAI